MYLDAALLSLGLIFMVQSSETVTVEPGKQVPQSMVIELPEGDSTKQITIPYLLFVPEDYDASGEPMPLLLFLHGLGESGDGDFEVLKVHGPPKFLDSRPDFPFIVASPQCPKPASRDEIPIAWKADQLIQLVDRLVEELNVDQDRVYITGLSMGGYGTWRLVANYPDRFAAAVPICGGGEPEKWATALARVPIWAFHGAKDETVPVARSEEMARAVRAAGGDVKLTVYPEVAHDSWTQTYNNDAVYDWLLKQRRD